jgi:signal transduction histidine kinase
MTVEDTGIGIGEDFQPHVFEPFKQESHGRTRDYDGTGLGLAITKHMVDLLGGTISVESQKDVGSTFRVDLPTVLSHNDTAVTGEELVGTPGEGEESAVRDE